MKPEPLTVELSRFVGPGDVLASLVAKAMKHVTAKRVSSLIRPEDVDCLFRQLGARPKALTLSEPVVPGTSNGRVNLHPFPVFS